MYHDYVMSPYLFIEALTTLSALWSRRSATPVSEADSSAGSSARPVCIYRPTPGMRGRARIRVPVYGLSR
jgi:hypothetical protein